jgi:hypothetical protein
MKITFVLMGRGLSGGVRVVVQHANLLRARGHDVTIVSQRLALPAQTEEPGQASLGGMPRPPATRARPSRQFHRLPDRSTRSQVGRQRPSG